MRNRSGQINTALEKRDGFQTALSEYFDITGFILDDSLRMRIREFKVTGS
jgi:hypothetical protein